jgi:hypothetical protein
MPPFRLQYASNLFVDLHRQKYTTLLTPACSTLVLLGNIGRPESPKTYHFLKYCSSNWGKVLWVPGPHELTNLPNGRATYRDKTSDLLTLCSSLSNVTLMASKELPFHEEKILLLGCSLWTPLSFPTRNQPEFTSIYTSVDESGPIPLCHHVRNALHRADLNFLAERSLFWSIVHADLSLVYLTHTLPSPRLLSSDLKEASYARVPMDCRAFPMVPPIQAWLGGASGSSEEATVGSPSHPIQIGVNSLFEYPFHPSLRSKGYDPMRVLEIQPRNPLSPPLPRFTLPPLVSSLLLPKVSLAFA